MIYTHAAAALVAAALAAAGTWRVQEWRYGEQLASIAAERATERAAAAAHTSAIESTRRKDLDHATRQAAKRAQTARRDADSARDELDRLRDDLRAALPGAGSDACTAATDRAAALGELLDQCATAHQSLARSADGHANDVRTLIDAWPQQ